MSDVRYIAEDEWRPARLVVKSEFGFTAEIRFPYLRERGFGRITLGDEWNAAQVDLTVPPETADDLGAYAEFALEVAHMTKTLDLSFERERVDAEFKREQFQAERQRKEAVEAKALQMRCEELAQYYMQLVRVQREGHSSNAKGELHVVMLREGQEDQAFQRRMYLKENNGNRWEFQADAVAKFEVKDGNRYDTIKLTPMAQLRAQASVQLNEEAAA